VVARKDEFRSRVGRLHDRLNASMRSRIQTLSRRAHVVTARPAFAAFPTRLAMRARRLSDAGNALMRSARGSIGVRSRRLLALERQLALFDAGRRLASLRTRLVSADGRMTGAAMRRHDRAGAQLHSVVGRLESLSPLAVLGRGYAVAWNADKSRVLRDAASVASGETIRVTLSRGEIEAKVSDRS
jgi:exodeoxyribonuclease VII large subunit